MKPYKIQSVVGIGSPFLSQSFYLLLGFSHVSIDEEDAHKFSQLAPYISSLLAVYDQRGIIWTEAGADAPQSFSHG